MLNILIIIHIPDGINVMRVINKKVILENTIINHKTYSIERRHLSIEYVLLGEDTNHPSYSKQKMSSVRKRRHEEKQMVGDCMQKNQRWT